MKTITTRWTSYEASVAVLVLVLLGTIVYLNWQLAVLGAIVVLAFYIYNYKILHYRRRMVVEHLDALVKATTQGSNYALQNLPTAIVLMDQKARICWSNSVFRDWFPIDLDKTQRLNALIPNLRIDKIWGKSGFFKDECNGRWYRVIYKFIEAEHNEEGLTVNMQATSNSFMVLYFDDITEVEQERLAAIEAMPVSGIIQMDNIEEVTKGLGDMEYTKLWAEMNNILVDEIDKQNGFIRNFQEDSYIFSISKAAFENMKADNFPMVSRIRNIPTTRNIPLTISVGIAYDEPSFKEQAERARFALELALGRGGDQLCVYQNEDVEFFGGRVQGAEKNTRVRARVVSQALKELMSDSDAVLIMGHDREDYDALAGSVGLYVMAKALGKTTGIISSPHTKSIQKMLDIFKDDESAQGMFISAENADKLMTDNTLVIVADVHRPDMVASPKILEKAKKRVVIDHHRRASDAIENTILMYIEPAASSTSELLTELIQYFGMHIDLTRNQASVMYAGIILDTKNFAVQTGARTFDAASYLRRAGANAELVRNLFTDTFDMVQIRAKMLWEADRENGLAFTECPSYVENPTVLAAQTADTLITVEGIEAGFVFYELPDHVIGVSARSAGNLNVQLIMETVGGGGHRTVAGAQLHDMTMTEAKAAVREAAKARMEAIKEE